MAVGEGHSKGEAERMCCYAACEKLCQEGILSKPSEIGGMLGSSFTKALHIQQQGEKPAILRFQEEELSMIEDALHKLDVEMEANPSTRMSQCLANYDPPDAKVMNKTFQLADSIPKDLSSENDAYYFEAKQRLSSPDLIEQWQARQRLPLWEKREKIISTIRNNQVVILTGETGSGKTTQVPQFVLEDYELQGAGANVHIVVTQPRRIAAISVAERVAWERGESLGKSVGYSIRLENVLPRPRGSILYCTTGILLRRIQRCDDLSGITHIMIDEVHERDLETDFLLIVVRELIKDNKSLRVVIMSATLNSQIYTSYFGNCPSMSIPGTMHPVEVYYLEDLQKLMDHNNFNELKYSKLSVSDDEEVDVDLVANVVSWTVEAFAKSDGAILCFLPGLDHIIMVRDRLQKMPCSQKVLVLPLHSQLPSGEQRAAFAHAPLGVRKVVLSTNIAETSVTIDDVVYVIDCGKVKEKQYVPSRSMNTLRVQWTSQASARQRQGRAGRVRPGFCFRLYSHQVYNSMMEHQVPEVQRVPLEELCLQIKALVSPTPDLESTQSGCKSPDISIFLSKALQPPKPQAVQTAVKVLQDLGAMDKHENLTALGTLLAKLGIPPRFGKMLIYGALLGCLESLLTIAAAACFRDPFVAPVNKRVEADLVRQSFSVGHSYGSDQLGLVNAFEQWGIACSRGEGNTFCEASFLAPVTMRLIAGMRYQLKRTLTESGIQEQHIKSSCEGLVHVPRCLLISGLYPNIASSEFCRESRGMKNATKHAYRWRLGFKVCNGRVLIHPTSVIQEKKLNPESHYYLVFQEKVQTTQVFVRGCTLLPPLPVILMGWTVNFSSDPNLPDLNGDWILLEVEGWIKFIVERRCGCMLLKLREAFHKVLNRWVSGSSPTDAERYLVNVVIRLLERSCNTMFHDY